MLLRINRAGNGYVSNYTLSISTNEARTLGFVNESGERVEIEKIVDEQHAQMIIRVKKTSRN